MDNEIFGAINLNGASESVRDAKATNNLEPRKQYIADIEALLSHRKNISPFTHHVLTTHVKVLKSELGNNPEAWDKLVTWQQDKVLSAISDVENKGVNISFDGIKRYLADIFNNSQDGKYFANIGIFADWLNDREGVNLQGLTEQMDAITQKLKKTPHDNLDTWRDAVREDGQTVLAALSAVEKLGIRLPAYATEMRKYLGGLGVKEEQALGRG